MWGYIVSVIIYFIIFKASFSLCENILEGQGRLEKMINTQRTTNTNKKSKKNIGLITICLIPVIRLIALIVLYVLCFCSDEIFNEICGGDKNENND